MTKVTSMRRPLIKDKQKIKACTSKQYKNLRKRNARINHAMSTTARRIINYCIDKRIGNLVVGYNLDWKRDINIGKQNNQNFGVCQANCVRSLFLRYKGKTVHKFHVEVI